MEGAGGRVAVESTGGALERSAGRPAGPEVHQPGDCARENLAVSSPARANHAPESGRTKESLSGRVESSPGVCAVGPPGGSDEARDRRARRETAGACLPGRAVSKLYDEGAEAAPGEKSCWRKSAGIYGLGLVLQENLD